MDSGNAICGSSINPKLTMYHCQTESKQKEEAKATEIAELLRRIRVCSMGIRRNASHGTMAALMGYTAHVATVSQVLIGYT